MKYNFLNIGAFDNTNIYSTSSHYQVAREEHLKRCLLDKNIDGYIMEFGVYKGTTINIISNQFPDEDIYGFDSFEGLPEDWDFSDNIKKWTKGFFKLDKLPIVNKNVKLIKGWYDTSVSEWVSGNDGDISILHIDCDLYSSAKCILDGLNEQIVNGTIIIFDEMYHWGNGTYTKWEDGEYKALREWMEKYDREIEITSRNVYMQCSVKVIK